MTRDGGVAGVEAALASLAVAIPCTTPAGLRARTLAAAAAAADQSLTIRMFSAIRSSSKRMTLTQGTSSERPA